MKIIFVRHGQTQTNLKGEYYGLDDSINILNKTGEEQAIETGKYLNKLYKFDLIISSSKLRAIQTAELIAKQVNYKKEIIKNNLIMELDVLEKYTGNKNQDDIKKIFNLWQKKLNNEKDPFKYINLLNKQQIYFCKKFSGINYYDYLNDLNKFLNQLKKLKNKCVLVVSHGRIMNHLEHLITNTEDTVKFIPYNSKEITGGNCNIMMCLLDNNKFKLVMPRNSNHLININNKN